jgi:hypothetical protein
LYVGASEYALPFFEHKGFTKVRRNEFEKRGVPMHNYTMEKLLQQPEPPAAIAQPKYIFK